MSGGIYHFAPSYDLEHCRADHERLLQALARDVPKENIPCTVIEPEPKPKQRQRRPSVGRLIAQAEKSGKPVRSVTTADGTTLYFGEPEPTEASNPWLDDLDKVSKQ